MKVFITKYALSGGIQEVETDSEGPNIMYKHGSDYFQFAHGEGKEWARTEEQAFAIAGEMVCKKIASLEKQIAKLEKLTFKVKRL